MKDVADGSPFDAEPVTEFVDRRVRLVDGDQLLGLIFVELPGRSWSVLLGRRRFGFVETGELLAELFQTLYLLLDSLHGGPDPAFTTDTFPWEYGIVAPAVIASGVGLLNLGCWTRRRSTTRRSAATRTARPA